MTDDLRQPGVGEVVDSRATSSTVAPQAMTDIDKMWVELTAGYLFAPGEIETISFTKPDLSALVERVRREAVRDFRQAAGDMLIAEWMVTHDWGGDRKKVLNNLAVSIGYRDLEHFFDDQNKEAR